MSPPRFTFYIHDIMYILYTFVQLTLSFASDPDRANALSLRRPKVSPWFVHGSVLRMYLLSQKVAISLAIC